MLSYIRISQPYYPLARGAAGGESAATLAKISRRYKSEPVRLCMSVPSRWLWAAAIRSVIATASIACCGGPAPTIPLPTAARLSFLPETENPPSEPASRVVAHLCRTSPTSRPRYIIYWRWLQQCCSCSRAGHCARPARYSSPAGESFKIV